MKTSSLDWKNNFQFEITSFLLMFAYWEDVYAYLFTVGYWCDILGVEQPIRFCDSKFFLDSRLQYESLEGSMDFLAFLVQTLW